MARGLNCVQTDDRLNCACPSGYNYTDAQHPDSGCTPAFKPQSYGGDNSSNEFTLIELPNITWETSILLENGHFQHVGHGRPWLS